MNSYIIIKIISIVFIVSYLTTFLVKKIANHVNAIDVPNERSSHTLHKTPVHRMGGLVLFISLLMGYIFWGNPGIEMLSVVIGSSIIILVGVIDDINPIKARYKFLFQLLASLIVVFYGGIYFTEFSFFRITLALNDYVAKFLSIFFILTITNAINLVDGLDGLATGISLIYFITIGIIGFIFKRLTGLDMITTIIMVGATLGFLIHNFPPAKIFLGDTGSLFLGFIIPVVALLGLKEGTLRDIVIPVLILGIPVLDTIFAILRRIVKKKKITSPDTEHFHHQILKLKLPHSLSILIIYAVSVLFSIQAILYASRSLIPFTVVSVILLVLLFFIVIKTSVLFDKKRKQLDEAKERERKTKSKK